MPRFLNSAHSGLETPLLNSLPVQTPSPCCPHRHAIDRAQLLSDGEDVQQGLCGVFSNPIPSIDHRSATVLSRQL